jgi:3-methyladenine DNA glycosylase AlkD
MTNSQPVLKLRKDLIQQADEHTKLSSLHFFKEKVTVHGVKFGVISKISKAHFQEVKTLSKQEFYQLIEELFKSGYLEEACIAGSWVHQYGQFEPKDWSRFENWIKKYIDNWAECDNFCNHAVGEFIEQYPIFVEKLKDWTKSPNRWLKRAAAVSLIIPAKKGEFLTEILEIADLLLIDPDDMVQKGYGWMLKEASKKHQTEIFEYVVKNKAVMPRTALRYAIEKMPPDLKKKAMSK